MRAFFQRQFQFFKETGILSDSPKIFGWMISLLVSCYVLILLAIPLYQTSAHKGIVFASDNDGGRAIETSMATRWYNSNHFAPYGNLYYRLTHSFADLVGAPSDKGLSALEQKEFAHNFSLKIVSLFSLFGLGLLMGWIFFGVSPSMLMGASAITIISTHMKLWSFWVFRPHPEHLLVLTTALAVYVFGLWVQEKENKKKFLISALMWGLAMAVKRSTAIFLPGIFIFILFPWKKDNLRTLLSYIGYMLLSYLVIGFPQNFGFYKHIKFLLYESSLHSLGDVSSMSLNMKLVFEQIKYIAPLLAIMSLFTPKPTKKFPTYLIFFVFLAFVPILLRKLSYLGDHHTMPLAAAVLILLAFTLLQYMPLRITKYQNFILLMMGLVFLKAAGIGQAYSDMQKVQQNCLPEMNALIAEIDAQIGPNKNILKEPTFPFNEKMSKFMSTEWGLDWSKVSPEVYFLGVYEGSYPDYNLVKPGYFYGRMLENWEAKSEFYRGLAGKDQVTSPHGVVFKKVFDGKQHCPYELWVRND